MSRVALPRKARVTGTVDPPQRIAHPGGAQDQHGEVRAPGPGRPGGPQEVNTIGFSEGVPGGRGGAQWTFVHTAAY